MAIAAMASSLSLLVFFIVGNSCHPVRAAPGTTVFPLSEPTTATYIGHASVLLRLNGAVVLTDPLYSERVWFYRRYVQPGMTLGDLPPLDVILISHGHRDHLDKSTLDRLAKSTVLVVPDGLQRAVGNLGFRDVRGLKPWEMTTVRGIEITAVPAQHFGTSCGYLIHHGKTVYFAGDTGLFDGMRAIGEARPIDLALLPIGAYRPHVWFIPGAARAMRRIHMAPEDVPEAAAMLGAQLIVPIHWGTFKLTGEPIDEPLDRLRRILVERDVAESVRVVLHGETIVY